MAAIQGTLTGIASRKEAEVALGLSSGHISQGGVIEWSDKGEYVKVRMISQKAGGKRRVAKRGVIHGFTHASRTRMQQKLAMVPRDIPLPLMLTLTYHLQWPDDGKIWKLHLKDFVEAFEREYGNHAILWRMEYQKRGAPHFHLLIFMEEDIDIPTVQGLWHWIAGYGSPAHLHQGVNRIERIRSWRGAKSYTAKYLGKYTQSGNDDVANGRHWGVRRWQLLGARLVRKLIPKEMAERVKWLLEANQLASGYKPRYKFSWQGMWTFLSADNVERVIEHARKEYFRAILLSTAGG